MQDFVITPRDVGLIHHAAQHFPASHYGDEMRMIMKPTQRFLPHLSVLLTICLLSGAAWSNDQVDYVLAPLQSEFHRSEISSTASAILILNGSAVESSREDDMLESCRKQLGDDLRSLSAKAGGSLLIRIQYCGGAKLEKAVVDRLKDQLTKLTFQSGYSKAQFTEEWTSADWSSGAAALGTGLLDDAGEEKRVITKELVAVALRTRISKLHAGNADVIIKLRRPLDARDHQLSDQMKNTIRDAVRSMKLSSARKLHFQVSSTKAGAEFVDTLFSNRQPPEIPDDLPPALKQELLKERGSLKKSPALALAHELGFKEIGYSHSSNGGAPELLLDKQAPAFELKSLDGRVVQWPAWRKDKPALITFWGVACGPCRLEAPHLSRLHEKYGEQIAIVGVNAYEESNETILAYVTKEKLKHPIVVGGSQLAKDYHVAAYPTTFWMNRRGEVVRYVIGFESGEELEAELVEFLANEN